MRMENKIFGYEETEIEKVILEIRNEKDKNMPIRESDREFSELVSEGSQELVNEYTEELREILL